jgi:hypothetical protein
VSLVRRPADTDQAVKGPWAAVGQARGSAADDAARLGKNGSHLTEKRLGATAAGAGIDIRKKRIGGPNVCTMCGYGDVG